MIICSIIFVSYYRAKWVMFQEVNPSADRYNILGQWDPAEKSLKAFNVETSREEKIHMTVAVDLVLRGIRDPVRFVIETCARVYPQNERFYWFSRKTLVQHFSLHSKEVRHFRRDTSTDNLRWELFMILIFQIVLNDEGEMRYEVLNIETTGELDRNRLNLTLNLSSLIRSPSLSSIDTLTPREEIDSGIHLNLFNNPFSTCYYKL